MSEYKIGEGEYYTYPDGKGVDKTIKEMEKSSTDELRLWIIQELSCSDSRTWWLIDIGITILKKKMEVNADSSQQ